ncbi:reticulon-4-interacting 1 like mitochondrial [Fusarium pseudocircinatum]|uniref:Reticulon-4-interacting 1 like mitochondrial n=1 Tax=Fusarium pseudocircinatum TaxID=56676 RepID=A0A8H5PKP7_9HYPO|nr:reticulon-4-interacting 1 like mitochondrial [Fusarium pseudocircinatum]
MKAVQILGDMSSPKLTINHSMEKPEPVNTDILVRVHAAGVTGDEIMWPETYRRLTRIPGHDISGVITAFGPDYSGPLQIGQEVFAFLSAHTGEGQADYVVCTPDEVALKPASLSYAEAAALPIPVLTAWEVLDYADIHAGTRVLVTGASGAVGQQFVQLIKHLTGAYVVALASETNKHLLGDVPDEIVDYKTPSWQKSVQNVDVVFDTVGGEVLAKTWETVKSDGMIITIGDPAPSWAFGSDEPSESLSLPGVKYKYFILSPNADRLGQVAKLYDDGVLKPLAVKTFPFERAVEAWEGARQRGKGNKVVIDF